MNHEVSKALELAITKPGVATKVQVLQGVESKEGLVTHAAQHVVSQVDLLDVTLGEVLERNLVDLDQLVRTEVDLAKVAERWELVSLEPGWGCSQVK